MVQRRGGKEVRVVAKIRQRFGLLLAATVVAATLVATPAGAQITTAGFADYCNKKDSRQAELRCCEKRNDTERGERQCRQNTRGDG